MYIHSASSTSNAKLNVIDLIILLTMWLVVFAASLKNVGYAPAIVFFVLNIILVVRNSVNGILVLLLIFYSPTVALGIGSVFVYSFLIIFARYIIFDAQRSVMKQEHQFLLLSVVLFVFYITITLIFAPDLKLAAYYYKKYIEGLALLFIFLALIDSKEKLGKTLKWWTIVAGIAIVLKLAYLYLGNETYIFNIMKGQIRKGFTLDERLTINIRGSLANRLIMPGDEPNYTSVGLIFPFAIAIGLFLSSKIKTKPFWVGISFMIGISIVGTYSRSGFLGIVIVLFLVFVKSHWRATIPISVVGLGVYILIAEIPQLHARLFGIGHEISEGASGRFALWHKAISNWLESPIWGKGFAFFYHEYHEAVHNTYLQILVETGILGLLLFIGVIFVSLFALYRLKPPYLSPDDPDYPFSRAIIIGLIGAMFLIGTVTYQDIKLFWITCGACTVMSVVNKKEI